jgi:hypothetical protein
MRYLIIMIAAVTAGACATQSPTKEAAARSHAANVVAAEKSGYKVINNDKGQTLFCATEATETHVASHIATCVTETQWEQQQLWLVAGPDMPWDTGESGRSPLSGSSRYGR